MLLSEDHIWSQISPKHVRLADACSDVHLYQDAFIHFAQSYSHEVLKLCEEPLLREQSSYIWVKEEEGAPRSRVMSANVNKRGVAATSTWFYFKFSQMECLVEVSDDPPASRCGGGSLSCLDDKRDISV